MVLTLPPLDDLGSPALIPRPKIAQPQACDHQEEHGIFLQIDAIGDM
jgi:hypothetical protein